MKTLTTFVLVAVVAACGGTSAPAISDAGSGTSSSTSSTSSTSSSGDTTGTSSSTSSSGTVEPLDAGGVVDAGPPNDPSCPKTLEGKDGHCTVGTKCRYPEGRCGCLGYCGGPPPPPDQDFSHWSCESLKNNGCPLDAPAPNSPCTKAVKCTYGDCCVQEFTCKPSTGWSAGPMMCPP